MVNVKKGILVECDSLTKCFMVYLDETNALGFKFILEDLDATHLFINSESYTTLKAKIDDLMDSINFMQEQI